jgi:acetylglutamate kinase
MIMHRADRGVATALRSAAPYIRLYKGETFVVKASGGVFAGACSTRALLEQLAVLCYFGVRVVLVHGGALHLTRFARTAGTPTGQADGPRLPGGRAADVTSMLLNSVISNRILAACNDLEVAAVGISAVDDGLVGMHRPPPAPPSEPPGCSFAAGTTVADERELRRLLEDHPMTVLSPLTADASGALHSIDADALAAATGTALGAEKLILCTGAPGILADMNDPRSLVSYTDLAGLKRLREEGRLQEGMLARVGAIENALHGGVRRVHVVSEEAPEAILGEVFSNQGSGTLVVADVRHPPRREKPARPRPLPAPTAYLPAPSEVAAPMEVY